MAKKCYKIRLLSELVLPKNSNTQGKNEQLNFIGGAVFLGLAARHYGEFSDPFAIFHSGKVRFGAARMLINGKMSYKTPFCFYAPKISSGFSELYNALFCDFAAPKLQEKQLKQLASGFINEDLCYADPKKNYALRVNLRTKEKELFGYESLQKGLELGFEVDFDESVSRDDLQKIDEIFNGEHCIGRSKNVEYGEVLFERVEGFDGSSQSLENSTLGEYDFIYVLSPLALFDKNTAMPSFELNANTLGLENVELALDKTNIKTRSFRAYNATRRGFDSARLIIEPGSVIAVRALSETDKARLKRGVGGFLSEGYGQVLVNPRFLFSGADEKPFKFDLVKTDKDGWNLQNDADFAAAVKSAEREKADANFHKPFETLASTAPQNADKNTQNAANSSGENSNLILALKQLKIERSKQHSDYSAVVAFMHKYKDRFKSVSRAQWGTIRAMAYFEQGDFVKKLTDYMTQERLREVFRKSDCGSFLAKFIEQSPNFISENPRLALQNPRAAAQLLAALMPKQDLSARSGNESSPKGDLKGRK